jgi:hypothetical protein
MAPARGHAQTKKPKSNQQKQNPTKGVSQKAKKLFLDQIEIRGWVAKPQMVYVIPGVDPKVDDIVIDRSFVDEITKPIDKDSFEKKYAREQKTLIPW